jgi:hypothetical protein
MQFRFFVASWSFVFFSLLGWLASHKSSDPMIFGRYSAAYFTVLLGIAALMVLSLLAQAGFLYTRLHKARREIILMVSAILSSLIIGETAIRAFDPLGISYFEESTRYQLDLIPDPNLVFKHAPSLRKTYQGVSVSTNELGLRDRKVEKKQNDELRILLLGDSATFGWGVPVEETFGRRLEIKLAAKLQHPNFSILSGQSIQELAVTTLSKSTSFCGLTRTSLNRMSSYCSTFATISSRMIHHSIPGHNSILMEKHPPKLYGFYWEKVGCTG